jgi:GTP-binding protein Era
MKARPMPKNRSPHSAATAGETRAASVGARAAGQPGTVAAPVAGSVAIIGAPNVGKSTLLNRIVGEKLAIVTPRAQTTRNRIVGVWTGRLDDVRGGQIVFVDTPGLHDPRSALGRFMVQEARAALADASAILLVVDAQASGKDVMVKRLLAECRASGRPVVVALNKVDRVRDKKQLLPLLQGWSERGPFAALVPISATRGTGVDDLVGELLVVLPPGPPLHDPDTLTDRTERFLAAELVREQLFLRLRQELPGAVAVVVEDWEERPAGDVVIDASILVEREAQKAIVVGRSGAMVRDVGTAARAEITQLLGRPAHLRLHVKVDPNWTDSPEGIARVGYGQGE